MGDTLFKLAHQTGFMNLTIGNVIMCAVALGLLYLAIVKEYEPLLLLPISFGMLLVNLYPPIMEEGGLLHYFFMLDGARAPKAFRGFHNEFLTADLLEHRKVMEVLGHSQQVQSTDGQLSGIGFNATVRDDVVVRINGQRIIRIKF